MNVIKKKKNCVLLCVTVCYCVLLCVTVCYCVLLCVTVCFCVCGVWCVVVVVVVSRMCEGYSGRNIGLREPSSLSHSRVLAVHLRKV